MTTFRAYLSVCVFFLTLTTSVLAQGPTPEPSLSPIPYPSWGPAPAVPIRTARMSAKVYKNSYVVEPDGSFAFRSDLVCEASSASIPVYDFRSGWAPYMLPTVARCTALTSSGPVDIEVSGTIQLAHRDYFGQAEDLKEFDGQLLVWSKDDPNATPSPLPSASPDPISTVQTRALGAFPSVMSEDLNTHNILLSSVAAQLSLAGTGQVVVMPRPLPSSTPVSQSTFVSRKRVSPELISGPVATPTPPTHSTPWVPEDQFNVVFKFED